MKPEQIVVSIGTLPFGFTMRDARMVRCVKNRYKGYLSTAQAQLQSTCSFSKSRSYSGDHQIVFKQLNEKSLQISRRDFLCQFQDWSAEISMQPSIYSFDACLRVLCAMFFPFQKSLLVHSSCIALNNTASLFVGVSGSGKTTITQLAQGASVLNDEICALTLKPSNNAVTVSATPFWGEMGTGPVHSGEFSVGGIYFLHKSSETKKEKISDTQSIVRLLSCVCMFGDNQYLMQQVVDTVISIVTKVPCYILHFEKNEKFMSLLSECPTNA